jgi:hypothetical protein
VASAHPRRRHGGAAAWDGAGAELAKAEDFRQASAAEPPVGTPMRNAPGNRRGRPGG